MILSPLFTMICLVGFLLILMIVLPVTFIGKGDSWGDRWHITRYLLKAPFIAGWIFIKEGFDLNELNSLNLDGTEEHD